MGLLRDWLRCWRNREDENLVRGICRDASNCTRTRLCGVRVVQEGMTGSSVAAPSPRQAGEAPGIDGLEMVGCAHQVRALCLRLLMAFLNSSSAGSQPSGGCRMSPFSR